MGVGMGCELAQHSYGPDRLGPSRLASGAGVRVDWASARPICWMVSRASRRRGGVSRLSWCWPMAGPPGPG